MDLLKARGYSTSAQRMLDSIGDLPITQISVARTPLSKATTFALNVASLGEFNKRLKETPHDKMFHLFMVISTSKGQFIVEKNDVIHIGRFSGFSSGTEHEKVSLSGTPTLSALLDKARTRMHDKFFSYKGLDNNCQYFVSSILKANGLSTPQLLDFVLQDTRHLFENNPRFRKIVNSITDTGAVATNVKEVATKIATQTPRETVKDVVKEVATAIPKFSELTHPYFYNLTLQNVAKRAIANPLIRK